MSPAAARFDGVTKIAVLRPNAVGDFVFALPALHALKHAYPDAELVFLGKAWHAGFLEGRPGPVDRVVVMPQVPGVGAPVDGPADAGAVERFVERMRDERFDIVAQMYGGGRHSNPFARRLGARLAIGARADGVPALERWVPHVEPGNRRLALLEIAALVGGTLPWLPRELELTPADRAAAAQLLPPDYLAAPHVPSPQQVAAAHAPAPDGPPAAHVPAPDQPVAARALSPEHLAAEHVFSPDTLSVEHELPPHGLAGAHVPPPDYAAAHVPTPVYPPAPHVPPPDDPAVAHVRPLERVAPAHVAPAERMAAQPVQPSSPVRPLVLLQPGSSDPRRCWPAGRFAALGDALAAAGAFIAVNGTAQEAGLVRRIVDGMRHPALNLAGKLGLGGLCGVLERSALVVSNDTGPLHLALAIGTPAVGIFWHTNLVDGAPLRPGLLRAAVSAQVRCTVCGADNRGSRCPHQESFVDDISVDEVLGLALSQLRRQ